MAATKWGCIGPGKISFDYFLAIQDNLSSSEHEFVAVASRNIERAKAFQEKFNFKKAYSSYEELADDKDVDIVYIGTLHTTHADLSIQMLKAGKHVICEKPMAMNYKQAKRVLDAAKASGKLFIEAVWSRWFPVYQLIQKELTEGTLGEPRLVQASFCVSNAHVERVQKLELGGGGLLDIGIYPVQFATMVFREMPETITVTGTMLGEVDEGACIILKYKNGAMANLTYHTNAGLGHNTATIVGPNGRIDVPHFFHCATKCTTPSGEHEFPLKQNQYHHGNSAGLQYEAQACREYLLKGITESPVFSHTDSELIHRIMDEIRRQLGMRYPDFD